MRTKNKMKTIEFYHSEEELYLKAKKINFQRFCKTCLKNYELITKELAYIFEKSVDKE